MPVIVRYSEIGLKSKPVRARMERALIKHLKKSLGNVEIKRTYGRIFVYGENEREIAEKASKVFGVKSTSPAVETAADLSELIKSIVEYAKKTIRQGESFALRVRREGEHTYTSQDVAVKAGAEVVKATNAKVKLKNPDREIFVEIRGDRAYIYHEVIPGVGGLPYGTQGRAVALVSGGIDSPVATFLAMKRGIEPVCVFLNPAPLVDKRTEERAMKSIKKLAEFAPEPLKTYIVPYGDVLIELLKVDIPLGCVLCKRMMYRVAELIALREKAKAIITGESLGQVASQTLDNLHTISSAIRLPVLRPLIAMDKDEIIEIARKIGTYEISILPANCCLGPPPKPATRATPERAEKAEKKLSVEKLAEEMVEKAVAVNVE